MKLLAGTLLLFTFNSFALDFSLENKKELSDLMYLPDAGTAYVSLDYTSNTNQSDVEYQSKNFYSDDSVSNSVTLNVGGAVTNNFGWLVSIPNTLNSESKTSYGPAHVDDGTSDKTKSDGLGDVAFSMKYRFSEQSDTTPNIDLNVTLSPKTGEAESASSSKDGNEFRGGTNLGIDLVVGKKFKDISFRGALGIERNGEAESKALSDNSTTKITSYNTFSASITGQVRPTEKLYFEGGLSYNGSREFESTNSGTKTEYTVDPYFVIATSIGYHFSKDYVAELNYAFGKAKREYSQGNYDFEQDMDASTVTLSLSFQI